MGRFWVLLGNLSIWKYYRQYETQIFFQFFFPVNLGCIFFDFSSGDAIKVFVRIRPPTEGSGSADGEQNLCLSVLSSTTIRLHLNPEPQTFTFDHIANMDTTQVMIILEA